MENKTLQFKTNLNCGGCVSKVQTDLDQAAGTANWKVDTDHADKILTVQGDVTEEEVLNIVKSKGFKAEPIG
jgi:copper chaperone